VNNLTSSISNVPNLSSIGSTPNPIHVSSNTPLQSSVFNTPRNQNQNQNPNLNNILIISPQFKQPTNSPLLNGTNYDNLFHYTSPSPILLNNTQ
jgi:hypothetical protein